MCHQSKASNHGDGLEPKGQNKQSAASGDNTTLDIDGSGAR
jgi:hypothetical protein